MAFSEHRPGIFFIIVAPAGAGKNSLIESVIRQVEGLHQLPTATTRPMRPGEQQGREHVFVAQEEFDRLLNMGALLEHQLVHGIHYYGILSEKVETALYAGEMVIADIEVKGARIARATYPENTVTIFIQPPSVMKLVERMRIRKENDAEIARRLMRVPMELEFASEADYIVINDDLQQATDTLTAIITAEQCRPPRQALPGSNYAYLVQVVPFCDGEALRSEVNPHFPTASIKDGELPYVAAARALNKAFGTAVPAGEWIYGESSEDGFMAPVSLQTTTAPENDQVTFVYQYQLAERITPPNGWTWSAFAAEVETAAERSE